MESLLLQRAQSYRWMIFHSQVLLADTALKRAFAFAVENSIQDVPIPDLDYATGWSRVRRGELPTSYCVDDHRVSEWLRGARHQLTQNPSGQSQRIAALMRVYDEISTTYQAAWRSFGEYVDAVDLFVESSVDLVETFGAFPDTETEGDEYNLLEVVRQPHVMFNEIIRQLHSDNSDVDLTLESELNSSFPKMNGFEGTWVVASRVHFKALKPAAGVFGMGIARVISMNFRRSRLRFEAEEKRPVSWAFFIPFDEDMPKGRLKRDAISQAFIRCVVDVARKSMTPEGLTTIQLEDV